MSELDDRIDGEVGRVARSVDGPGSLARVAALKRRRRAIHWMQRAALATVIVVGTAAGTFALTRAFDLDRIDPGDRPQGGPTTATPTPGGRACPNPAVPGPRPTGYSPVGPAKQADVTGEGPAVVTVLGARHRPAGCRYLLEVAQLDGPVYREFIIRVPGVPGPPALLLTAEIDGQPGVEVVIEHGGPGHPHRTGQIFTYEPGPPAVPQGSLILIDLNSRSFGVSAVVPLFGEFPAGVDCTRPGTIVVTEGDLAEGGVDDSRYEVVRTVFRAQRGNFVQVDSSTHVVEVGTEDERWPELADDSFRSCPRG